MKKKKILVVLLVILVLVFIGVYFYANADFENNFNAAENTWIKENSNKVIDIEVPNDYPVFGESGIFRSFIDDYTEETGLSFNVVPYLREGNLTGSGLNFRIISAGSSLQNNDLLLQEDPYALFGKNKTRYDSLSELGDKTIGVITSDSVDIIYYLKKYTNLKFKTYDSSNSMFEEYENDTLDYLIVPINMYLNRTLVNEKYNIQYVFSEMSKKIVLSTDGNNTTLNNITRKFFNRWKENSYVEIYNDKLLNYYVTSYKINDKDRTEFLVKKYNYGYVENYPYEVQDKNGVSGIGAEYLNRLQRLTNTDFINFVKYKDIDSLKKDIKEKKVDIYFNYFDYEDENYTSTISPFVEKYLVIGKKDSGFIIESFESMKGLKVSIVTNNAVYNYFKDNSKASLVPYSNIDSMLKKKDTNLIVIDKEVYNYYRNSLFKDYEVLYEDLITNEYNFMVLNNNNTVFYRVFNYLISTNSYYRYRNSGLNTLNRTVLEKSSFGELYVIILAIILLPLTIIFITYLIIKHKKKSNVVKKEERRKYTDILTSLKNRNYLNYSMDIWNNNRKYPQAIIIVDLNNVKYVNDNYGHEQGDKLIVDAASVLVNTQLENSELVRSDGNEFLIYLVGYSENQVSTYTKKLIKEFKKLPYGFGAAVGYSMIQDEIKSVDDAINEATLEMKKDKENFK